MSIDSQPPLVHRAMIESGATSSRVVRPYNVHLYEQQFGEYVQAAECADRDASEVVTFLRRQPSDTIKHLAHCLRRIRLL